MDAVHSFRVMSTTDSGGMPTTFSSISESVDDIVRIHWTACSESLSKLDRVAGDAGQV
jgi:hypothetical protein